jgi:hypothetical protein
LVKYYTGTTGASGISYDMSLFDSDDHSYVENNVRGIYVLVSMSTLATTSELPSYFNVTNPPYFTDLSAHAESPTSMVKHWSSEHNKIAYDIGVVFVPLNEGHATFEYDMYLSNSGHYVRTKILGFQQIRLVNRKFDRSTSDVTLTLDQDIVFIDSSAGNKVANLPQIVSSIDGKIFTIKNNSSSGNTVAVSANSTNPDMVERKLSGATPPVYSTYYDLIDGNVVTYIADADVNTWSILEQ